MPGTLTLLRSFFVLTRGAVGRNLLALAAVGFAPAAAHQPDADPLHFPPTETGMKVLSFDSHVHTAFSDGSVWPDVRVAEAEHEGLDGFAVTDHIDTQFHGTDLPNPDRNRAYRIASDFAARYFPQVLVINGVEIAFGPPAGLGNYAHFNAIFIADANALRHREWRAIYPVEGAPLESAVEAVAEAKDQDAFVIWNHPALEGPFRLFDVHRELLARGLIDGVEVARGHFYSEEAFRFALDNDLAIFGASDIHAPAGVRYNLPTAADIPPGRQRTVTLVLTRERTQAALVEAMRAHRTIALVDGQLLGRERELRPVLEAALRIEVVDPAREEGVILHNAAPVPLRLRASSDNRAFITNVGPEITVPARGQLALSVVREDERQTLPPLAFAVLNALTAPGEPLRLELTP